MKEEPDVTNIHDKAKENDRQNTSIGGYGWHITHSEHDVALLVLHEAPHFTSSISSQFNAEMQTRPNIFLPVILTCFVYLDP